LKGWKDLTAKVAKKIAKVAKEKKERSINKEIEIKKIIEKMHTPPSVPPSDKPRFRDLELGGKLFVEKWKGRKDLTAKVEKGKDLTA